MGERREYAERRYLARQQPDKYMSTISDGMAQLHCLLPYFGNQYTVNVNYRQHIQGIINHGRTLTLYRTFNNICNGSNLAIHTWLLNLEAIYEGFGSLPDTIFAQIDGGSENANTTMKGICELLVARGLTKKVVLSRLPPGHTHEDIDAVFGKIWKYLAGRAIYTPQGYQRALVESLKRRNIDVTIVNVLCVPDYRLYMKEYLDSTLTRCDKEKWSELQWIFESVGKNDLYPNGVKVVYRKYSANEVYIIDELTPPLHGEQSENISLPLEKSSSTASLISNLSLQHDSEEKETEAQKRWKEATPAARDYGFDIRKYKVNTHPMIEKDGDVDGMYVLKAVPDGTKVFHPQPFVMGSRKELEKLVEKTVSKFGNMPGIKLEWESWRDFEAPQSDDAVEYCRDKPLKIPFWDQLFSGSPVDISTNVRPIVTDLSDQQPEYETTNSVLWSNRGQPSKPN